MELCFSVFLVVATIGGPGPAASPTLDLWPAAPPGEGITPVDQAPDALQLIPAPKPLQRAQRNLMPGSGQLGTLGQLPLPVANGS